MVIEEWELPSSIRGFIGFIEGDRYARSRFQRQQPTSGETVRSLNLEIVFIVSLQTVSSTIFRA